MTEEKKQIWAAYGQSLTISYVIAACFIPFFYDQGQLPVKALIGFFLAAGFVFGTVFFLFKAIPALVQFPSFGMTLLVQSVLLSLTVLVGSLVVIWTGLSATKGWSLSNPSTIFELKYSLLRPIVGIYAALAISLGLALNAFLQFSQRIGPGVLRNWIIGRYSAPKEEERIFMVLSVSDSASLLEKLGGLRFGELIRDVFGDIANPVLEAKGEVSRYWESGALFSWKSRAGLLNANCVNCFFDIEAKIESRRQFYRAKYGVVPRLTAGLHIGTVVAIQVGEIKSDLLFHGAVVKEVANIQAQCGGKERLLVSNELVARLGDSPFRFRKVGEFFSPEKSQAIIPGNKRI